MVSNQRRLMRSMDTTTKVSPHHSGVQRVPAPPAVGTGGSGDADILIDVRKRPADGLQLLALSFRVAARQLGDSGATGADVAVGIGHRSPSNWFVLRYTFVTHA